MSARRDKVAAKLDEWGRGEEIARHQFHFDTQVSVRRVGDRFTVLRAFMLGNDAVLSVDLHESTVDQLVRHLVEQLKYDR